MRLSKMSIRSFFDNGNCLTSFEVDMVQPLDYLRSIMDQDLTAANLLWGLMLQDAYACWKAWNHDCAFRCCCVARGDSTMPHIFEYCCEAKRASQTAAQLS